VTLGGFLAVGIGAALGAWLRWIFGIVLNPLFGNILLGTLAANLVGGFLIGVAVEYFVHHDSIPPEWRLFVIVGFLGGLTTFSSFSAEAVELLSDREFLWSFVLVAGHLLGSLAMTYLGILTARAWQA
jgi:CrcB protein